MIEKDMVVNRFRKMFNLDIPREQLLTKGNCYWCQFVHACLASALGIGCLCLVRPRKMIAKGYKADQFYLIAASLFFFTVSTGRFMRIGPPPKKHTEKA